MNINKEFNSEIDKKTRNYAVLLYLSAGLGLLIPFGNIAFPLIIFMLKREDLPFINQQGKEIINFQITFTIFFYASVFLGAIFSEGIYLLSVLLVACNAFLTVVGAIKVQEGVDYKYPFKIVFLK